MQKFIYNHVVIDQRFIDLFVERYGSPVTLKHALNITFAWKQFNEIGRDDGLITMPKRIVLDGADAMHLGTNIPVHTDSVFEIETERVNLQILLLRKMGIDVNSIEELVDKVVAEEPEKLKELAQSIDDDDCGDPECLVHGLARVGRQMGGRLN